MCLNMRTMRDITIFSLIFFLFKCSHILLSFFFLLYFKKNNLNKIQYSDPNTPFSSWSIWILNAQPRNKIIKLFFLKALVKIYMSCAWGCPTIFVVQKMTINLNVLVRSWKIGLVTICKVVWSLSQWSFIGRRWVTLRHSSSAFNRFSS